jgi:hypothetical protein
VGLGEGRKGDPEGWRRVEEVGRTWFDERILLDPPADDVPNDALRCIRLDACHGKFSQSYVVICAQVKQLYVENWWLLYVEGAGTCEDGGRVKEPKRKRKRGTSIPEAAVCVCDTR